MSKPDWVTVRTQDELRPGLLVASRGSLCRRLTVAVLTKTVREVHRHPDVDRCDNETCWLSQSLSFCCDTTAEEYGHGESDCMARLIQQGDLFRLPDDQATASDTTADNETRARETADAGRER